MEAGGVKMADYKAMYLAAMDAMEQAVQLLAEAQQKCECCRWLA